MTHIAAPAAPFASLAVFGDSLSDEGAYFDVARRALSTPLPPEAFGYAQRFSDGPTHAGRLAAALGLAPDAVESYAVGGARALGEAPFGAAALASPGRASLLRADADSADLAFDLNLGGQVARYLADLAAGRPAADAVALFIGSNDYNAAAASILALPPDQALGAAVALIEQIVGAVAGAAQTLVVAGGARTVLLYGLIDGFHFPAIGPVDAATQALFEQIVNAHNAALGDVALGLAAVGVDARLVDTNLLFDAIIDDPTGFGFLETAGSRWLGTGADPYPIDASGALGFAPDAATAGLDADQLLFFDLLHPTSAAHRVIAAFTAATLDAPASRGGDAAERVAGGHEGDVVFGFAGDDRLFGRHGDDVLFGGRGDDRIDGGDGDDLSVGGAGDDRLFGGHGDDVLAGSDGDDKLKGGEGDDLIALGNGSDRAWGGAGDDLFLFVAAELAGGAAGDRDRVDGEHGHDVLLVALDAATLAIEARALVGFRAGDEYRFRTIDLRIDDVEEIRLVEGRAGLDRGLAELAEAGLTTASLAADWNLV